MGKSEQKVGVGDWMDGRGLVRGRAGFLTLKSLLRRRWGKRRRTLMKSLQNRVSPKPLFLNIELR